MFCLTLLWGRDIFGKKCMILSVVTCNSRALSWDLGASNFGPKCKGKVAEKEGKVPTKASQRTKTGSWILDVTLWVQQWTWSQVFSLNWQACSVTLNQVPSPRVLFGFISLSISSEVYALQTQMRWPYLRLLIDWCFFKRFQLRQLKRASLVSLNYSLRSLIECNTSASRSFFNKLVIGLPCGCFDSV